MSSTHLRLEGPDLPSLLDQVRAEYGPGARIVHAERIRRGGVGGFFARERYHIDVEVSEVLAAGGHGGGPGAGSGHGQAAGRGAGRAAGGGVGQGVPAGPTARTVLDLVERLNQEEHAARQRAAGPLGVPVAGSPWPGAPVHAPGPSLLTALTSTAATGSPPLSTQSASFADVLSRLQHSVADTAPTAPPEPGPVAAPTATTPEAPGVSGEESPAFVPLGADPRAVVAPTATVLRQQPATVLQQHLPTPAPHDLEPRGGSGRPVRHDDSAELVARAVRLGVPAQVLEDACDAPTVYRRLLSWVESRPPAPLMTPAAGQVIAVVGELSAAMRVARALAFELGVDPSRVHLAVPATSSGHDVPVGQLLSDPADIAVRRHRWRHSASSTIVVVEAALPPAARAWVSSVVSALAPTFTWAVAQASTKVADVVSWAELIGEVDAVALENVPATGDPAASLAGPLPIGLLDGRRASVSRWMAMLTMEGGRR